jgi:hypothetical protein
VIVTLFCYSKMISNGMIRVESPRKVPRRDSITGRRLGGCIFAEGEFALGDVTERGAEYDDHAHKTREANEGEADVGSREDGPGFHVIHSTVSIIAFCSAKGKGGLPYLGEVLDSEF